MQGLQNGLQVGNGRQVHMSTQLKSSESLTFLKLWLQELRKADLRKKNRKNALAHVIAKPTDVCVWALGTARLQPYTIPLGSSLALLPLNQVCFETPCGTQMAELLQAPYPHSSIAGGEQNKTAHANVLTHMGPN